MLRANNVEDRSCGDKRRRGWSKCTVQWLSLAAVIGVSPCLTTALADTPPFRDPQKFVAELPINASPGHEVAVPVFVNHKGPFNFIVDTGATSSGIWQSVVAKNDLRNKSVGTVRVSAADGVVAIHILDFEAFRAGPFALEPPRLMEFPDYYSYYSRPLSGILGADYLTRHVVVFDFPRDMLVLYPAKTNLMRTLRGYFDAVPLDFDKQQKALFVRTVIGRKRLRALVDTGASMTTILTSQAKALGVDLSNARRVVLTGVNGNPVHGHIARLPELRAGSRVWRDIEVVFAPFTVSRAENFTMLLGMDLMGQTPFAIDYGRKRLLLAKPEKVAMVARKDPLTRALVERPQALACSFPEAARQGLPCLAAPPRPALP